MDVSVCVGFALDVGTGCVQGPTGTYVREKNLAEKDLLQKTKSLRRTNFKKQNR